MNPIITARQCLAETTHFSKQRIYLARSLADMVAAGINPDSAGFRATYRRFTHSKKQIEMLQRMQTSVNSQLVGALRIR